MRGLLQRSRLCKLWSVVGLVGVVLVAIACGQEAAVPDPVLPDSGAKNDASTDSFVPDGPPSDASSDAADVVCPDVLPDDATGLYVAPSGTNGTTCGTRAAPCKTLNAAITRAIATATPKIYAARGAYVERVVLAPGVEIVGGWDIGNGTTWKRACVTPEEVAVLRAPATDTITVEARDLGGEARLSLLRIETKAPAQVLATESLYALVAVGVTTTLVLNDVHVVSGAAGAGTDGLKGDIGTNGGLSCPTGTGTNGAAGTPGAGAPSGTFSPSGYGPGTATGGGSGSVADNGTAPGTGTCVQCGACDPMTCAFSPVGAPSCGKDGVSGCAGGPGVPGAPGTSGGSSIGVYVWDATVTINGGTLRSGDAGNGGIGGPGGASGAATKGTAGSPTADCVVGCQMAAVCTEMKAHGNGGAAGGIGGVGGVGGAGGGGGGGSSFAIYQGGSGVVTTTASTTLAHGKAGTGGGPVGSAGASGAATDRIP